MKQLVQYIANI